MHFTLKPFIWYAIIQAHSLSLALPKIVSHVRIDSFSNTVNVPTTDIRLITLCLRNNDSTRLTSLVDIAAVDRPEQTTRFFLYYLFQSFSFSSRLTVKVALEEATSVPSLSNSCIFASADWLEREVYDLFGIYFSQHRDLRRTLTDYGFAHYPLRKDFPVTGLSEIGYLDVNSEIVENAVELSQEGRFFQRVSN
jgi:NADH:ubiquinone oxidoreductase subunit C